MSSRLWRIGSRAAIFASLIAFVERTPSASYSQAALDRGGPSTEAKRGLPGAPVETTPPSASPKATEPEKTRCEPDPPLDDETPALPATFATLFGESSALIGSASSGAPTRGSLFGAALLHESEGIRRAGDYGFGTSTVIHAIERAVREVRRCHPDTPALYVGDIAREHGGWLRPHRSHQSGLDADIGYYYVGASTWYERATAKTLDAPRTWALMRALIEGGNVDTMFVDASIQRLLKSYLATLPEGERLGFDPFESPQHRDAMIRHAWGHATHFHVRFRDPGATLRGKVLTRLDSTGETFRSAPFARLWITGSTH